MQDIQVPGPFVVLQGVAGDGLCNTIDHLPTAQLLNDSNDDAAWHVACRRREQQSREEWVQENNRSSSDGGPCRWGNCVVVWHTLPTLDDPHPAPVRTLWPGTVLHAVELITLQSTDLMRIENDDNIDDRPQQQNPAAPYPHGQEGWLQIIRTDEDEYIPVSVDGYHLLGPGMPCDYAREDRWLWRVTCPDGAWVRHGLSLSTECVGEIPYGALVTVYQKVVNEMALSRLQVEYQSIRGWCSEFLNPLSGQSGTILRPLPLTVPMQVRVDLSQGAVVRQSVELSSPVVTHLDVHTVVAVTQKAFSEIPAEQCVPRLRVAQGWISLCLNSKEHEPVVVSLGTPDPTYSVTEAAAYHRNALSQLQCTVPVPPTTPLADNEPGVCVICLTRDRTATIVHGETGHVACCLVCARILKARKSTCPVCRLPIDSVIQHFWA